jgi:general nucleoside transport system ATP-binding protein
MQPSHKNQPPMISLRGITKSFADIKANDHIDLDIYNAEIHALLGENGAGKSTLMKILFGFYHADSGGFLLDGNPISIQSPLDARSIRIGMVFQDLNLIPAFTVAENIALFLPHLKAVLNPQEIEQRINEVSRQYGLEVHPRTLVSQLSIGEQQKVEILKLLLSNARLLILDEPTRVLAPHEVKALYSILDNLRKDGYAIVLITHKMKEVLECADRITVLRRGRVTGSLLGSEASEDKLLKLMFEKEVPGLKLGKASASSKESVPVIALRNVETQAQGTGLSLKDINILINSGEIVGLAGVSGNGQKELCDVILGMETSIRGEKWMFGKNVTNQSVHEMRKNGVCFIPENPLLMASVPFMTVLENMALTNIAKYARRGGFAMDWSAVKTDIEDTVKNLGFTVNLYTIAKSLSGGNLQRMIILREMMHHPRLIVASYLTRGLDVQSAIAARQALIQARDRGVGVLLVSEDLDELFTLSDRLLVLFDGKIVGQCKPSETDIYSVGLLMTGSEVHHATSH